MCGLRKVITLWTRGKRQESSIREEGREESEQDLETKMVGRAARRKTMKLWAERMAVSWTKGAR